MPEHMKRAVIKKVNITRQGPKKWKSTKKTVICNMHYLNFKGPSRPDNNVIPIFSRGQGVTLQLIMYQRKEDCYREPPEQQRI